MRNLWIVLLFCVSQLNYACQCASFNQVRREALQEGKFMLVHFTNIFTYEKEDLNGNPIINPVQESPAVKQWLKNYKYVCVSEGAALFKRYNISHFPQLLLIDGNGIEVYRFQNLSNSTELVQVLENFQIPPNFLSSDMINYSKRRTYATAMRLAQKYLDYSLLIDDNLQPGVFKTASVYLQKSEKLIPKRDAYCKENFQKLRLLQLYELAYRRDFLALRDQLIRYEPSGVYEDNRSLYYFLKYITAKALLQDDFPQIEKTALSLDGFENFVKKSDLILAGQKVAQSY